ncbi:hypothetical protein [Microcoleus phage My-WqHQDG]|nr:hypothetical protein [Microcoleus phage My-WqHQDG]
MNTYDLITPQGPLTVPCSLSQVSDGYHTFGELHDHIDALFARLCIVNGRTLSCKSMEWKCLQEDDVVPKFLVCTELPPHGVVARYLPLPLWERLDLLQVRPVPWYWSTKDSTNIPRLLGKVMPTIACSSANGTITTPNGIIELSCPTGMVSDGYSTFTELYNLRHALFIALSHVHLCSARRPEYINPTTAWKSRVHEDGTMFDNDRPEGSSAPHEYFIAGIKLPGGMISYHLPIELWGLLTVSELEAAPAWDGHTASDVVDRLLIDL